MDIVQRRAKAMIEGLGIELSPNPLYDAYYGLIDFEFFARKRIGEEAVEYLKKNVHPLDLAFRLADDHGIVLLNGGGFDAPDWSLRVSLANLDDRSEEHTSELQSHSDLVCRLLLEKKKKTIKKT